MLRTVLLCVFTICISSAFPDSIPSADFVPCEEGWYFFRDKCYKAGGREPSERLSWFDALAQCKSYGADLASIQSQEEQDFVTAYPLLNVHWWAWIGLNYLHDIEDFKWTDGSIFNYSNWHYDNPSFSYLGEPEYCVQILMYPDILGQWNDKSCNYKDAYICEKNTNPQERSHNPMYCLPEEGGGWSYRNSCYHIVSERKTWENAEKHCKHHYSGHLLTIHDKMEDYFLELAIPDIKKDMWIGIKMENMRQLKWTSGWYVSFEGFSEKGTTIIEGNCVARKGREDWVTIPCSTPLPFICEVSKESPPVLKPPPRGAGCPEGQDYWRDLGGEYCYYFEATKAFTFDQANYECIKRGGHMASLHSQEEADILQPFFKYKQWSIFTGLHRQKNDKDTFGWTDGTELDYQNWNNDQPDNVEEPCVEMWILSKKWNNIPCNKVDVGYVCSVKKMRQHAAFYVIRKMTRTMVR